MAELKINEDKVLEVLSNVGKPMKSQDIVELSGVNICEVRRIVKILVADGKIKSPKRFFYEVI